MQETNGVDKRHALVCECVVSAAIRRWHSRNALSILGSLAKIAVTRCSLLPYLFRLPCYVFVKCISEHLRVCFYVCVCTYFIWMCYSVCVCACRCVCVCVYRIDTSVCLRVCWACHVHSLVPLILASPNLLCWTVRMWSCWVWLQTACRAVPIQRCSIIYAWKKTRLFTCTPLICYTGRFL